MLTYKRKLILTKAQQQRIDSWIGACRFIYNMCLEIKIAAWRNRQQLISKYELMSQLKDIRCYEWIGDVPHQAKVMAIDKLDKSYTSFLKRFKFGVGFPRFKSKRSKQSVSFKDDLVLQGNVIRIPKIGYIKMFKDAPINGKIAQATIKKEITGYYISITCKDVQRSIQNDDENQVVGLDMGVAHFAVDSNGVFIANPKHFKKYERQLRIENRSLARKKKDSSGWKKQVRRLALLHHKIANVRKDFLHKASTDLAKNYHTVFIEDLNVQGMVRNPKLSKHILDCGWSEFRRMLEYKTEVVAINPKYTSQSPNSRRYYFNQPKQLRQLARLV